MNAVKCPHCQEVVRFRDNANTRDITCPFCKMVFMAKRIYKKVKP